MYLLQRLDVDNALASCQRSGNDFEGEETEEDPRFFDVPALTEALQERSLLLQFKLCVASTLRAECCLQSCR